MKRLTAFIVSLVLILSLAACGSTDTAVPEETASSEAGAISAPDHGRILIAYFAVAENSEVDAASSASVLPGTGDGYIKTVADEIQARTGGEEYSIQTEKDYLGDYEPLTEEALEEQRNGDRPALEGSMPDLDAYDTIFLGVPVWWSDLPMPVYTFLESCDLAGKTIVPFVTHYGSRFGRTVDSMKALQPDAVFLDGIALNQDDVAGSAEEVTAWLSSLGF